MIDSCGNVHSGVYTCNVPTRDALIVYTEKQLEHN